MVSFLPTTSATRVFEYNLGIFFREVFLSGLVSRVVFGRRACYLLVWLFSIPADSLGISVEYGVSGNRKLRFEIRVDNSRFFSRLAR